VFGILEAMASALPVVPRNTVAYLKRWRTGVTGLLVAEYNVNHMAAAMAELLNDQGRAAAMGEGGPFAYSGQFHPRESARPSAGYYEPPAAPDSRCVPPPDACSSIRNLLDWTYHGSELRQLIEQD
jgi:glycosyltransferase involved in cell wall biosynthesis